jgi:predicted amidohydrolase YtcJ
VYVWFGATGMPWNTGCTYTIDAAWQDFADGWKGSLEPGKVADLCVLDGDLLGADPHDIPSMPVVLTVMDGRIVHDTLRD